MVEPLKACNQKEVHWHKYEEESVATSDDRSEITEKASNV